MPTRQRLGASTLVILAFLGLAWGCNAYEPGLVGNADAGTPTKPPALDGGAVSGADGAFEDAANGGAGMGASGSAGAAADGGAMGMSGKGGGGGSGAAGSGGAPSQAGSGAAAGGSAGGSGTGSSGGSGGTSGSVSGAGGAVGGGGAGSSAAGSGGAGTGSAGTSAGSGGGGSGGSAGDPVDAGPCMADAGMDCCTGDPNKTDPGVCGCGVPDSDVDFDGVYDCVDPALGWQRALTLDGAQVKATLTTFPVLIRITDSALGTHAAANGSDIYFLNSGQTSKLPHEIESYGGSNGALVAWVRVPSLAASSDTVIYLRYGGGGADRADPSTLWSGHFYVWHLSQDPGPGGANQIRDATGRAHATAASSMSSSDLVDAVVGKGINFSGSTDLSFTNSFTGTGPSTISAWVNQQNDNDGESDTVIMFGTAATSQTRVLYATQAFSDNILGGFYNNDVDSGYSIEGSGWKYVSWVWDGSNSRFYVNGTQVGGASSHTGANTTGSTGRIGNSSWASRYLRGQLDELRVSSSVRSAEWIEAEYNNQRANSTFLKSMGAEQAVSAH